ncbi:MAG TPA: hypothetical protein VFA89_09380 [Terriglobales bacterium]|nr:hypothetical protein [Terriglobales bacterium]
MAVCSPASAFSQHLAPEEQQSPVFCLDLSFIAARMQAIAPLSQQALAFFAPQHDFASLPAQQPFACISLPLQQEFVTAFLPAQQAIDSCPFLVAVSCWQQPLPCWQAGFSGAAGLMASALGIGAGVFWVEFWAGEKSEKVRTRVISIDFINDLL